MIVEVLILLMSLVLIFYLSQLLSSVLSHFANKMKINSFFVGSIILAFSTSLPELIESVVSTLMGVGELGLSSLIGSNISNITFILAVTSLIRPIRNIYKREVKESLLVLLITVLFIVFLVNGVLSRIEGAVLILVYVYYQYYMHGKLLSKERLTRFKDVEVDVVAIPVLAIGSILAGYLIVNSTMLITEELGVSLSLIGLTVLAVGTSMPELGASVMASVYHHSKLAVGNVIGSNMTNLLLIAGLAAVINPISVPLNWMTVVSLGFLLFSTALLEVLMIFDKDITKKEGIMLLLVFVIFLVILGQL